MADTDKKLASREALLDAAVELFASKGFSAVSTRDIADAAKVNLGTIQYHFGSKAGLFVEALRRLVQCDHALKVLESIGLDNSSKTSAAGSIARFVFNFMNMHLRPSGPQACRLVYREILSETAESAELCEALVSAAVSEFMGPVDRALIECVQTVQPKLSNDDAALYVQSIVGQCAYYVTNGPFLERLRGKQFSQAPHLESAARHIICFSLRGLCVDETEIRSIVNESSEWARLKELV